MKKLCWVFCFAFLFSAWLPAALAGFEYKTIKKIGLSATPLDVAISPNEKWYYILTDGNVLIYSVDQDKVVETIPVEKGVEKIVHAPENNQLVLTGDKSIQVLRIDRIHEFSTENSPFVGPDSAPVTITIFNHYQCPYCARLDPKIKELRELFGGAVKVVYKSFPPYNTTARKASAAAVAAHAQGKFWEMHEALHSIKNPMDEEKILGAAETTGLDMEKFKTALDDPKTMTVVDRDIQEGLAADVDAVPYFFINGKHLKNENLNHIYQVIQEEIVKSAQAKAPVLEK